MNHKPIQFKDLGLIYPHKNLFSRLSSEIHFGVHIAQVIEEWPDLIDGQRLNQISIKILSNSPNFLLLDEQTNHLDKRFYRSLIYMFKLKRSYYEG